MPARFLKITCIMGEVGSYVCMSVCVCPLGYSGMICTHINKFYSFYMTSVVSVVSRYDHIIEEDHRN